MKRTIEQQIAETTNKLQRLKTKQKSKDTRRKIVLGAILLAEARANPQVARIVLDAIHKRVTREVDRRDTEPVVAELTALIEGS